LCFFFNNIFLCIWCLLCRPPPPPPPPPNSNRSISQGMSLMGWGGGLKSSACWGPYCFVCHLCMQIITLHKIISENFGPRTVCQRITNSLKLNLPGQLTRTITRNFLLETRTFHPRMDLSPSDQNFPMCTGSSSINSTLVTVRFDINLSIYQSR
jgi:hypothetical protein